MDYPEAYYAQRAYRAYCKALGIEPEWIEVSEERKEVWLAVAKSLWAVFQQAVAIPLPDVPVDE